MSLACEAFEQAWFISRPNMAEIKVKTSGRHGVSVGDIVGPSRLSIHVKARHEAIWRARQATKANGDPLWSLAQIGAHFGGRDHTTVLNACRRHEERMRGGLD